MQEGQQLETVPQWRVVRRFSRDSLLGSAAAYMTAVFALELVAVGLVLDPDYRSYVSSDWYARTSIAGVGYASLAFAFLRARGARPWWLAGAVTALGACSVIDLVRSDLSIRDTPPELSVPSTFAQTGLGMLCEVLIIAAAVLAARAFLALRREPRPADLDRRDRGLAKAAFCYAASHFVLLPPRFWHLIGFFDPAAGSSQVMPMHTVWHVDVVGVLSILISAGVSVVVGLAFHRALRRRREMSPLGLAERDGLLFVAALLLLANAVLSLATSRSWFSPPPLDEAGRREVAYFWLTEPAALSSMFTGLLITPAFALSWARLREHVRCSGSQWLRPIKDEIRVAAWHGLKLALWLTAVILMFVFLGYLGFVAVVLMAIYYGTWFERRRAARADDTEERPADEAIRAVLDENHPEA